MSAQSARTSCFSQIAPQARAGAVFYSLLSTLYFLAPQARAQAPSAVRLHFAQLLDRRDSAHSVVAARLLVPTDWTFDGQVHWDLSTTCFTNVVTTSGQATSPDSLSQFEFFPAFSWMWTTDSMSRRFTVLAQSRQGSRACRMIEVVSAADYIRRAILPRYRPNARVIATESMPKFAAAATARLATSAASTPRMSVGVDAARVKIVYEIDGHPVEEWIMATVERIANPMPARDLGKPDDYIRMPKRDTLYVVTARELCAYRAPAGHLDSLSALIAMMASSIRPDSAWVASYTQMMRGILRAQQPRISDPGDPAAAARRAADDATAASAPHGATTQHPDFDEFAHAPNGLAKYTDPTTHEPLEFDARYPHAYTNRTGTYLLTDSPTPTAPDGPWTPLGPTK